MPATAIQQSHLPAVAHLWHGLGANHGFSRFSSGIAKSRKPLHNSTFQHFPSLVGIIGFRFDSRWRYHHSLGFMRSSNALVRKRWPFGGRATSLLRATESASHRGETAIQQRYCLGFSRRQRVRIDVERYCWCSMAEDSSNGRVIDPFGEKPRSSSVSHIVQTCRRDARFDRKTRKGA